MNSKKPMVPRALLPALGLLSALVAFGGTAMAASTIAGSDDPVDSHAADHDGPVTPRVAVASGTSESFGDWELVVSRDGSEQPCIGLRFTNLPENSKPIPEDVKPSSATRASSPYGPSTLVEACGAETYNQVGNFTASPERSGGTMFFGSVDNGVSDVRFVEDGKTIETAKAIPANDGRKYVTVETAQRHPEAEIVAISSDGESLGRVDPEAIPATE